MPLLIVADLAKALRFYSDALGFEVRAKLPIEDPFFAIVGRDSIGIMLKCIGPEIDALPNPSRHPWAKWDAMVSVKDPKDLAVEFARRDGVQSYRALPTRDGLFGFEVVDADGYVLFFGRPNEVFAPEE